MEHWTVCAQIWSSHSFKLFKLKWIFGSTFDIWFDSHDTLNKKQHGYFSLVCDNFINKEGLWKIGHFHSINRFRLWIDNDCENIWIRMNLIRIGKCFAKLSLNSHLNMNKYLKNRIMHFHCKLECCNKWQWCCKFSNTILLT